MRTDQNQWAVENGNTDFYPNADGTVAREPFSELSDEEVQDLLGLISSQFPRHSDYTLEQFKKAREQARLASICQARRADNQSWRQIENALRETEPRMYSYVYLRTLVGKLCEGKGSWGFLSQKHKCGRPRRLTCREILEVLYLWTENTHRPRTKFFTALKARWKSRGKKSKDLPKYDTINSLINSVRDNALEVFQGRFKKYNSRYWLTADRYYPHVYHTWQFDEHHVKMLAKCPRTGRRFYPHVIGAIDCVSRLIPGAELLERKSTTEQNLAAIYEAARPKDDPDDVIQGLPENIQYDNEAFFDNPSVRSTLSLLGIVPIYIKKNCPRENARIERFFRTVKSEFFSDFYSYVRRKCSRKQIYKEAICFDLLKKLFQDWLHDYNYKRIHTAHGRTPVEVYLEQRNKIVNFGVVAEDIRSKFVLVSRKTVHHSGIIMPSGFTYKGEALAGLIAQKVRVMESLLYDKPPSISIRLGDTDQPRLVPLYEPHDLAAGDVIRAAGRAQFKRLKVAKSTLRRHSVQLPQPNAAPAKKVSPTSQKKVRTASGHKPKFAPPPKALPILTRPKA